MRTRCFTVVSLTVTIVGVASRLVQGFLPPSTTNTFYRKAAAKKFVGAASTTTPFATQKNKSNEDQCDCLVLGGGFGGLYTALAISREAKRKGQPNVDVVLVDPSDRFVFLPLLYDLTVGTATEAEVCPLYKDILAGTGIRHVRGSFDGFNTVVSSSSDNDDVLSSANVTLCANHNHGEHESCVMMSFRASVVAVGATPESSLASVPGASDLTQPFYTQQNAKETRQLLQRLEGQIRREGAVPRIAIIGGGYGGVELAACIKRKLPESYVRLLTRSPPMKGTRAEPLINQSLKRLGVNVELSSVHAIEPLDGSSFDAGEKGKVVIQRTILHEDNDDEYAGDDAKVGDTLPWDAVLWTAGAGPAYPVSNQPQMSGLLSQVESGRLAIDDTLRCIWKENEQLVSFSTGKKVRRKSPPPVWALGDCAEIINNSKYKDQQLAVPKTAQAAMQQAETVASNVLADLQLGRMYRANKTFRYQDLGTMLTLGGPNAAVMAPRDDNPLSPVVQSLLDGARVGLGVADDVLLQLLRTTSPVSERVGGITPSVVENLGLSLGGGHGLGGDNNSAPGTLSGTLTGAVRRAVYASRMPTNRQRVYAAASAAISTATTLAKEASDQIEKKKTKTTRPNKQNGKNER